MARELVHDLATGKQEYIDFVPVHTPNSFIGNGHRPLEHKRFVSQAKHHTRRLSSLAELVSELQLPKRYQFSKINTGSTEQLGASWRDDLYKSCYRHGDFSRHMVRAFTNICDKKNFSQSMQALNAANDRLNRDGYSVTISEEEIKELAKRRSKHFHRVLNAIPCPYESFDTAVFLIGELGLAFSENQVKKAKDNDELFSLVNRAMDEQWLVRQLRRKCAYELEQVARDLALVERHKQVYCSDFSVSRHRARCTANKEALQNTVAYDQDNEENWFTLSELAGKSVSNPEIRRTEMFVRLRGFEECAQELGHEAVFFTVTAPSRFHAVSKGQWNPKWLAGGSPTARQTHAYLLGLWQALGRTLSKKEIKVYGIRIVEPHQDGTPHHHMLLFMESEHREFVVNEFRRLAMEDSSNEKGAKKYRFKAERIDPEKGSAVGYVSKYLSKNVDGLHIDKDRGSSLDGAQAAERVVTWARVNQIRQFQFVGGPSVSVWREMRRLREEFNEDDAMFSDLEETEHYLLEKVRKAADVGDWKAFCYAMGGVFVKRKDQPVRLEYSATIAAQKLIESGEYSATRYGDKAQAQISGLMFKEIFLMTRFRTWKLENKKQFLRAQKQVLDGVTDWFDALEKEREYERMCEERFAEYERHVEALEELEALVFCSSELPSSCSVGAAPPDWMM
ncbi:replication protein [Vibrio nigripulchritudo]|nr:replication endonuclease [Vibrio nigripulchritudo]KJY76352.1 replication protein [Vibrio nigripulchritudo]